VFAFAGVPATDLIDDQGQLLDVRPATSLPVGTSYALLQPDGDIGVLPASTYFDVMDTDDAGKLHAIIDTPSQTPNQTSCENGGTLERIDIASATVEASAVFTVTQPSHLQALQADPQGGVLLACGTPKSNHRVLLLPNAP